MPMTVEEVVHLGAFQTAKIRTGIETLSQRRVEWMSAIEGPVEHFVRKKEFILTSGMGFENDEAQLLTFVKDVRSEEHTSELQSRFDLVCRLLLEKKKQ